MRDVSGRARLAIGLTDLTDLTDLRRSTDPFDEDVVPILEAAGPAAVAPTEPPPVLPEPALGREKSLIGQWGPGWCRAGQRRYEEGVGGAVGLAHETGLAVRLPGDHRMAAVDRLEDVRRAHLDADVAVDAPTVANYLDHDAAICASAPGTRACGCVSGRASPTAVQTRSRPPTRIRWTSAGSVSGWSSRT